jgi:hypothetical protein
MNNRPNGQKFAQSGYPEAHNPYGSYGCLGQNKYYLNF